MEANSLNWKIRILGVHLIKQMQVGKALLPAMPRKGPSRKAGCWVLWNQKTRTEAEVSFEDFYSLVHSLPTPTAQGGGARINSCIGILCPRQLSQVFLPKVSFTEDSVNFSKVSI